MKIGVLTARSASGEMGGAERLFVALVNAFRESGHETHEIPVVADEATYTHILRNYLTCYDLEVSNYDLIISTKAPTWMVRHPNHVCYLMHTVRVFYDMFDAVFPDAGDELIAQRELIHRMDTEAMSFPKCRSVFTQSNEVTGRLREWNGLESNVLHPPLWSNNFRTGAAQDYLLLPGRLHPWKRVDLVIRAMDYVKAPLRLIITGTGIAENELKVLASRNKRIEFRGRVTDSELVELYAHSFAVPFTPKREDYGYITLEAFASGKPVITCTDSGEAPTIVDQVNGGYVCTPDPQVIGEHIDLLWENRKDAEMFGQNGREWVEQLSWQKIVHRLVSI